MRAPRSVPAWKANLREAERLDEEARRRAVDGLPYLSAQEAASALRRVVAMQRQAEQLRLEGAA